MELTKSNMAKKLIMKRIFGYKSGQVGAEIEAGIMM